MVGSIQQALDLLGVAADSDLATVVRAYRRLARTNHPDVCADPDAAQRFAAIATAYHLVRDHTEPPDSAPVAPGATPNRHTVEQPAMRPTSVGLRSGGLGGFWPPSTGDRVDDESWGLVGLIRVPWPGAVTRSPPIVAGPVRISLPPSPVTTAGPESD